MPRPVSYQVGPWRKSFSLDLGRGVEICRLGAKMDNVTHTLCGLALARAGAAPRAAGRLGTAAVVVGANLPDIDAVVILTGGQAAYLLHHRGITHALAGLAVEALILAAAIWAIGRVLGRGRVAFLPILAAAAAGLGSHPLLDLLNTYGIRPWLPFDATRYHGDAVFIVDPWLWLVLGAGACLARRGRAGTLGWAVFFAAATAALALEDRGPRAAALAFAVGAAAILGVRAGGVGAARGRVAAGGLLVAALYVCGLAAASRLAEVRGLATISRFLPPGETVEATMASPAPGVPWRFEIVAATAERIHRTDVDLFRGRESGVFAIERRLDDPAIAAARGTREYEAWRSFARLPFAGRHEGKLILGDARYARRPVPFWCNLEVPLRE